MRDKSNADILIVLDGKTPPVKERQRGQVCNEHVTARDEPVDVMMHYDSINVQRTKAFKRAGAGKHFSVKVEACNHVQKLVEEFSKEMCSDY